MNAATAATPARAADTAAKVPFTVVPARRGEGFGTGYGRSSGYAMDRRYTTDWGHARFRCA